ncbi:MAG: hypothetical protein JW829_11600 [Pirellulales bacterium]|nr:hypothetical protein [Pirellulales bacterium]
MADQYELTCSTCGNTVLVGQPQAGSRVACRCGEQLDVPTLLALQNLPTVKLAEEAESPAWSFQHGLIAIGFILTVACAIPGVYFRVEQSTTTPYRMDTYQTQVIQQLDAESPLETWIRWHHRIVPLAEQGLTEFQIPDTITYERKMERLGTYQIISFGAAGIAALGTLIALVWLKRR